jgi:hypothetical protein
MSKHDQKSNDGNSGKGQNPGKPNLPGPGKNPDFPEDEPIGPPPTTKATETKG